MMEDTLPPGMTGPGTWAPPDLTLQAGTKAGAPATTMTRPTLTVLTLRAPEGLTVVDLLRGLTAPTCLKVH